ncbi:hypothetical protein GGS20DRAFT_137239 [Poronia punctata]|nr:hypothetical protein GGS20DRAFT_137239 [Poronia punctata]
MASCGGSRPNVRRAPLGDATDRVLNAPPYDKAGKPNRPPHAVPNPLRSHATNDPVRGRETSKSSLTANRNSHNAGSDAMHPRPSHVPRHRASVAEEIHEDKRISQLSASSGASSGNRKTHIGPWQLGKTLGKGSAARVRLARHRATQDTVAVKILAKNMTQLTAAGSMAELDKWDRTRDEFNSQRQMPLSIEREVAILKLINHPNIVKLHDIWENRAEIYLVLEYMDGGDMFTYINHFGPVPEFEMMGYFRQILSALEYVHSFNICHRDLKPENILMKSNGIVKIADFGMAAIQQSPSHALKTSCGSPHYAAPELIARQRYQLDKVDIWSLGCILYATLCRRLPFDDPDGDVPRLLAKAAKGVYVVPDFLSKEAKDLIARMLRTDPQKRISIRKIWQHPLVRKYDDLDDLNSGGGIINTGANDRSKPVPSEELDLQILRQLKSMWHTFSEKQIAMQLTNAQPNDQKLFYWLLFNYREEKLENYDMNLTYSASDYHHLRPSHWKKKLTTAEFPSRYGRTPSRFTVISTVPTDGSIDETDNATDGGATILSYDPYKSSRIIENVYASHAKIVVHRNCSTAKNSSRSSASRRAPNGSVRSTSTNPRPPRTSRRIAAPAALRASRQSLCSIQSGESAPYTRPASRRKRGVDFSHLRSQSRGQNETTRAPVRTSRDATYGCDYISLSESLNDAKQARSTNGRRRQGTQSMMSIPQLGQDSMQWNEEVREFSHSIAKDCDDAFNASLLSPESCLGDIPADSSFPGDAALIPAPLAGHERPWDRRPLPPTPTSSASILRRTEHGASLLGGQTQLRSPAVEDESNRRIVSAPIYSQYSTQWGKDKIPLPSINEKHKVENRGHAHGKHRIVSAPIGNATSARMDDQAGLEFLAQHENTIRIVNSPAANRYPEANTSNSKPSALRNQLSGDTAADTRSKGELDLRQRYLRDGPTDSRPEDQESLSGNCTRPVPTRKKSSWFKRGSKDKEDLFNSQGGSTSSRTDRLTYVSTNSSEGRLVPPAKKKSFNIAFWRNSKDTSQMPMSLAATGARMEDAPSPKATRILSHTGRSSNPSKWEEDATTRNIEPQQSWLARLFRVKPATKHLCFSISRRRVRQEMVILLKEWRKYGIRDVQVDKERNIVFARVGKKNYLNLKEVAFAAEIMTVIEHGKRGHLSIARFTQERGAASSFHKVVDTINSVFSVRNLLIVEKRKVKMMIKTLNS